MCFVCTGRERESIDTSTLISCLARVRAEQHRRGGNGGDELICPTEEVCLGANGAANNNNINKDEYSGPGSGVSPVRTTRPRKIRRPPGRPCGQEGQTNRCKVLGQATVKKKEEKVCGRKAKVELSERREKGT
eukprot:TRINITY_DN24099_c0_g1_i2.p3 TRINITY_DN24099_c0_g1~~TRINITY_DN24099_c0_g1_i2.p3  ORF type:complete len:133 (+),score=4.80 TRINITY_DN24099_c0_g1_i2:300-698(+)